MYDFATGNGVDGMTALRLVLAAVAYDHNEPFISTQVERNCGEDCTETVMVPLLLPGGS